MPFRTTWQTEADEPEPRPAPSIQPPTRACDRQTTPSWGRPEGPARHGTRWSPEECCQPAWPEVQLQRRDSAIASLLGLHSITVHTTGKCEHGRENSPAFAR